MFARVEVGVRPPHRDAPVQGLLRRIELALPETAKKIRWARLLDVYWLDLPLSREEMMTSVSSIFYDPVLNWVLTGNLIPSLAGPTGNIEDLLRSAPNRPGKFWGIERRFRPGVTDNVGRTTLEAFEIMQGHTLSPARGASGSLLVLEGDKLDEDDLSKTAREVFCNELIETFTLLSQSELQKNDRFHQEQIRTEFPRQAVEGSATIQGSLYERFSLHTMKMDALEKLSTNRCLALNVPELKAIQNYFANPETVADRIQHQLPEEATDVELEVLAQTWSEHCKHKLFNANISYNDKTDNPEKIPSEINSLFKTTIAGTTSKIQKPWLLSVFHDNAGIVAFDDDDAVCIKVETHNSPSALDPYGGALTGIVGVNRDILGCGLGAKPIFNTDVFCLASPSYDKPLPERLLHPRRILDGVRRGVEHGGNKSGIPTVNGALYFDDRYLGKPLIYCGTGGFLPRKQANRSYIDKVIQPGDRICMVGGRIGKDGIHGATFSSLALDRTSPSTAVQLGDPITQKRMSDFLLEARDRGLYRAITDNGAGGLSSSVGELAQKTGGAKMDVSLAKTKYPGLRPWELTVSESQERMTVAVPEEQLEGFLELARRRSTEVSVLGEFNTSGFFEVFYQDKPVARLKLAFLHDGTPKMELKAVWNGPPKVEKVLAGVEARQDYEFKTAWKQDLLSLLSRPNIASKEWLIRQYDHEVQGMSVVKPLHTAQESGPNDAGVIQPKPQSHLGLTVGCGLQPRYSDWDAYLMAQLSVDEAVRNLISVGAEYGKETSVMALVDNFCWPDPVGDTLKAAHLVRACFGMQKAALELGLPLVSGKDSMKNDYKGYLGDEPVHISVPPTLLMTAIARVNDVRHARTSDFKQPGDVIYLLGGKSFGLVGSEWFTKCLEEKKIPANFPRELPSPDWKTGKNIYTWLADISSKPQIYLKSCHDISDGGLLVSVAEGLLARGLGAEITIPAGMDPFVFGFGEGFHSFVVSVSADHAETIEANWKDEGVPFVQLGKVAFNSELNLHSNSGETLGQVSTADLRKAWKKEGYWE